MEHFRKNFEYITVKNNDPLKHNFNDENTIYGLTRIKQIK